MLDRSVRRVVGPAMDVAGRRLAAAGVTAVLVTALGFATGIAAAVAAGAGAWSTALLLWLASRLLDGLDGAVARARGPTDLGGWLDIVADFTVYGAFVVGVAVAVPEARLACAVLLATYYVNGSTVLALSSMIERRRLHLGDERSVRFSAGLAEGTETIIAHALFCVLPAAAATIAWVFAAMVGFTAARRVLLAIRVLR